MKKFIALLSFVFIMGVNAKAEDIGDKLMLYIPNRIVDFMDMFSVELGFGPTARAEVRVTRAFAFGAGWSATADAIKACNRQYGFGLKDGWDANFICISAENTEMTDRTRYVDKVLYSFEGVPSYRDSIYNVDTGSRDYWEIGVQAGAGIVELDAGVHPVEVADFITGLFFYDFKGDDFTVESINR